MGKYISTQNVRFHSNQASRTMTTRPGKIEIGKRHDNNYEQ